MDKKDDFHLSGSSMTDPKIMFHLNFEYSCLTAFQLSAYLKSPYYVNLLAYIFFCLPLLFKDLKH